MGQFWEAALGNFSQAPKRNNAYRHGMRSRSVVIPGEDRAAYERLLAEMKAEHQPNTKHELFLVRQMTDAQWRLERLKGIEAALFDAPARGRARLPLADPYGTLLLPLLQRVEELP